ncbi:MAG: hypothetical protein M8840_13780 [marine benthic group bacterium]|jgi:cytochrome c-type protein NapB|nr:hypothetical protein [Gemmatimonadota bacterium]MCL7983979.1 hypothetical protein [Gemmatimonadota bacterium]MCL7992193.1 hypothetical protein [Gemmatimonadota bacterium]
MRRVTGRILPIIALAALSGTCTSPDTVAVPGHEGARKSSAEIRAERRAYDGAPPVIPHRGFGADCVNCHNDRGRSVSGVGYAPASPHEGTRSAGGTIRCMQCHVFRTTDAEFVASEFDGVAQALTSGDRATAGAPPRIPHRVVMRENCLACHDGPGAREAIRTTHPERTRCRQCHLPIEKLDRFTTVTDPVGMDLE